MAQTETNDTTDAVSNIDAFTRGAYSRDRFADWTDVIVQLRARGFSDQEVVAILMSKWARWAADQADRTNDATAADLFAFLDSRRPAVMFSTFKSDDDFRRQLAAMVEEIF